MADQLIEVSSTKTPAGDSPFIEDYNQHPALCREGVWMGLKHSYTQEVRLSFEHSDHPEYYVGWSVNGATIEDPGYDFDTSISGAAVPGIPSLAFVCPVDGEYHNLILRSASGSDKLNLIIRVLYRAGIAEANLPPHLGPWLSVSLRGYDIEWPAEKLAEERACLSRLAALLGEIQERFKPPLFIPPGDPFEWLRGLRGNSAVRIEAAIDALKHLKPETQPALVAAIGAELRLALNSGHSLNPYKPQIITRG